MFSPVSNHSVNTIRNLLGARHDLETWDMSVSKTDKDPWPWGLCSPVRDTDNNCS